MTESRKRRFGVALLLILLNSFAIIGVIVLGVVAFQQSERAATAEEQAAAESEQRGQDIEALRDQVYELGETPVVAPPTPGPSAPPSTRDGRDGEDGEDGQDGQNATPAQIAAAVAEWCAANGNCIGATGRPGADGNDGRDGQDSVVPGPMGPQGPAGPVCPEGYTASTVWVAIADSEDGTFTPEQATICRITPAPDPAPIESGEPTP
ncbi:MAG: hypothetical protein AAGC61_01765 [Microbacterium sp.]